MMYECEKFIARVSTRFSDCVNHGAIDDISQISFIREAALALLCPKPPRRDLFSDGVLFLRHDVTFHRELHRRGGEPLPIELWVETIRGRTFTLQSRARCDGHAVFSGKSVLAVRQRGRRDAKSGARPMTEAERSYLERFTVPQLRLSR